MPASRLTVRLSNTPGVRRTALRVIVVVLPNEALGVQHRVHPDRVYRMPSQTRHLRGLTAVEPPYCTDHATDYTGSIN